MNRTTLAAVALTVAAIATSGAPNSLPSPKATPNPGAVGGDQGPAPNLASELSSSLPDRLIENLCLHRIAADLADEASRTRTVEVTPPTADRISRCVPDATQAVHLIATHDTPDATTALNGWRDNTETNAALTAPDFSAAGTAVVYDGKLGWWFATVIVG